MDDLISKGELLESLNDWIDENTTIQDVMRWISEFEVAYNVDKVCEQLDANAQKMSEAKAIGSYAKCSPANHRYYKAISVKKAKEIIKAGGVNESQRNNGLPQ